MRFTGTLIEDLMATVERAERKAQADEPLFAENLAAENLAVESLAVESWFASTQENAEYDSKFIGVA